MERLMIKGDFVSRKTRSTRVKKKKPTSNDDNVIFSASLPYELLVLIVARVPISYHRTLSLVSKSFRSMLASPELHKVRSLSGLTESCLYVCLSFGLCSYKWYTLSSKRNSGGYVLGRVTMVQTDDDENDLGLSNSELVAVGSDIYTIMEADHIPQTTTSFSGVWILDCKSHTWRKARRMPVELDELSARVLDGKIYVLGRIHYQDGVWENSFQVFDTNRQTWDLPCRGFDLDGATCVVDIDGKLHALTLFDGVFALDSKQCRWVHVGKYPKMRDVLFSVYPHCEIDGVLYSVFSDGVLRWYDTTDKTRWRDLMGLVGLPELPDPHAGGSYVQLTGYGGGKMMVFWNRNSSSQMEESIYCAEIALERRDGDCWGKLEWCDGVLSVHVGTEFVKVLPVTL